MESIYGNGPATPRAWREMGGIPVSLECDCISPETSDLGVVFARLASRATDAQAREADSQPAVAIGQDDDDRHYALSFAYAREAGHAPSEQVDRVAARLAKGLICSSLYHPIDDVAASYAMVIAYARRAQEGEPVVRLAKFLAAQRLGWSVRRIALGKRSD